MLTLLANLKIILPIILLVTIFILITFLDARLKTVESERDSAQAKLTLLSAQIEKQNAAIISMKQQAQALQIKLKAAEFKASKQAKIDQKEVNKIIKTKVPVDCQKATKWGAQNASKIAREWQ